MIRPVQGHENSLRRNAGAVTQPLVQHVHGSDVTAPTRGVGDLEHGVSAVVDETLVGRGLDEGDGQREHDPAEQGEEQHLLAPPPSIGQTRPERDAEELDEGAEAHENSALRSVHAQLLEVDSQQREERAERPEEEEVEELAAKEVFVDHRQHGVDEVTVERVVELPTRRRLGNA